VVEAALDLAAELSVLVARDPHGEAVAYAPARNHHERQALDWSVLPGGFAPAVEQRARDTALALARGLDVTGLLCVEFFLTRAGELLVNELAPRPHNSYHASPFACATGQFEQLVRAVTGLPLGAVDVLRPAAIANLFGDLWHDGTPAFEKALAVPGVTLTLYGKPGPRPGRKMGHLTAIGESPDLARERVLAARDALALHASRGE
jgi:5-(carboxyamino)imidazole ribonucleotide synthase